MAKIVEMGIDYVTITEKDKDKWNALVALCETMVFPQLESIGHTWDSTRALGYTGARLGTLFLGSRADSSMLRVSGADADWILIRLMNAFDWLHVTRLDVQATIAFEGDRMLYAEEQKANVLHHQEQESRRSHPKVTLISSTGNGDTLQVGSRASEIFVRLYDKWREQKLEYLPYTWRYEIELKKDSAQQALQALRNSQDRLATARDMLVGTLEHRGFQEPVLRSTGALVLSSHRAKTDSEKSLRWLREHVAPTVRKLLDRGHRETLLDIFSDLC